LAGPCPLLCPRTSTWTRPSPIRAATRSRTGPPNGRRRSVPTPTEPGSGPQATEATSSDRSRAHRLPDIERVEPRFLTGSPRLPEPRRRVLSRSSSRNRSRCVSRHVRRLTPSGHRDGRSGRGTRPPSL
jgi:hypothetical protein